LHREGGLAESLWRLGLSDDGLHVGGEVLALLVVQEKSWFFALSSSEDIVAVSS
jgi:hypothetical protein